jgi:hypothetical protein
MPKDKGRKTGRSNRTMHGGDRSSANRKGPRSSSSNRK